MVGPLRCGTGSGKGRRCELTAQELQQTRGGSAVLELTQVSKGFAAPGPRGLVMAGVNLRIGPGEFVAITGPAAAGKTTLLRLMAGLDAPTTGVVAVAGRALGGLGDAALARLRLTSLGTALPGMPLLESLDLLENVALPLLLAGVGRREARAQAEAALRELALTTGASLAPEAASPSQRQLAQVARAVAGDASLLLLDEPTAQLGPLGADRVLRNLRQQVEQRNRTVVIATSHAAVAAHADREYRLSNGTLEEI